MVWLVVYTPDGHLGWPLVDRYPARSSGSSMIVLQFKRTRLSMHCQPPKPSSSSSKHIGNFSHHVGQRSKWDRKKKRKRKRERVSEWRHPAGLYRHSPPPPRRYAVSAESAFAKNYDKAHISRHNRAEIGWSIRAPSNPLESYNN